MSQNLDTLLSLLTGTYDLMIFDSAPVLAVPDTQLIWDKADALVFVVRWAKTKHRHVRKALSGYADSRERPVGVLLNIVNVKKYIQYGGYGKSGYYYGQ